jgi:alanyl-tRNA synthetase
LKSTGEIGFVKIVYTERVQDGVERLGYAVGLQALKRVQEQESLLWRVSETLSAPVEKLDKTAEKLVKELKETNAEKRRLIKELAAKESAAFEQAKTSEPAQEIGGLVLVKRDFGDMVDVNRMVQTANAMIKRNERTVTLFYGAEGKTARIVVNVGKDAVAKGVNANKIVRQVSAIIGGGGGGRPNFAQAGGTKPEKLQDAVKAAEEAIRKQLKR